MSVASADADNLIIGVLEQPQTALCSSERPKPAVRLLFGKTNEKWVPLKTKKSTKPFNISTVSWTAAFDGKEVGQVVSEEPKKKVLNDWTYPRDYLQNITSRSGRVEITNSKNSFVGWCGAPTMRPVVLVSQKNYEDPDGWKPFKPDGNIRQALFAEFKKSVGKTPLCYIKDDKYFSFKYNTENLKLLKSYRSNRGELIQVTLDREYTVCNDELGEGMAPSWFSVKGNTIKYVGEGMELVDAGDYDADGKSELIFWYSGYNENGYVLLYDDLKKKEEFLWSYH
jgi:hypothetical protein